jgi:hypothetical protein
MPRMEDGSLSAVAKALAAAGFEPEMRLAPHEEYEPAVPGVRVPMPGENAWAVIRSGRQMRSGEYGIWWREPRRAGDETAYGIGFHEAPFRTRGHGWGAPAGYAYGSGLADVLTTVREWSRWEVEWPVQPPGLRGPDGQRLIGDRHDEEDMRGRWRPGGAGSRL